MSAKKNTNCQCRICNAITEIGFNEEARDLVQAAFSYAIHKWGHGHEFDLKFLNEEDGQSHIVFDDGNDYKLFFYNEYSEGAVCAYIAGKLLDTITKKP